MLRRMLWFTIGILIILALILWVVMQYLGPPIT